MDNETPGSFAGTATFTVTGMTCGHCEHAVSLEISAIDGVESVAVDLATGTLTVTAASPVERADVARAVTDAGYTLVP